MLRKILYVIIFSFIGINSALVKAQSTFFIEPIVFNKVNTIKYSYLPTYYDKSEIFSLKPNRFNFNQKVNFGFAVGVDFPKRMTSISLSILEDFVGSNYEYSVNYFESNVSKFYTSKSINQTNLNVGLKIKRVLLTNHRFLFSNKLLYQTDLVFGINSLNGLLNKTIVKSNQQIIPYNDTLFILIKERDYFDKYPVSPIRLKPSLGLNFLFKTPKHELFNFQIEYLFSNTSLRRGQPLDDKFVTFEVYNKKSMELLRSKSYFTMRNYGSGFYFKISKNFVLKKRSNKVLPKRNGIN